MAKALITILLALCAGCYAEKPKAADVVPPLSNEAALFKWKDTGETVTLSVTYEKQITRAEYQALEKRIAALEATQSAREGR